MRRIHRKFWVGALVAASVVLLNTAPALAQDGGVSPESVVIDNLWVLIAGVLVFIMQAGFGMVEAGMTRAKNVGNIMAKNLADVCVGALAFFAVGYGIAYGTDAGSLLGVDTFLLSGAELGFSAEGGLSIFTDFFFQVVFAATAVTIASGAMAERTKMSAYLVFSFFMTALIYPVVVHSFWSGEGLVADLAIGDAKFGDFAGSTIVHSTRGWAVGLFARYNDGFVATDNAGLFYGGGIDQLLVQLIGAAMVFVWVVVTTGILFAVIKRTVGLRVSRQAEISGLDIFEHGQPGYVFTTAQHGSAYAEAASLAKAGRGRNGAELDHDDVGARPADQAPQWERPKQ